MKKRYFARISYLGSAFHGWQRQNNAPSVQQNIEEALRVLLGVPISIYGCGRTDKGVHAKNYYFHFDGPDTLPRNIIKGLNALTSSHIVIHDIVAVRKNLHARFNAIKRTYNYTILKHPDPFRLHDSFVFVHYQKLDVSLLNQAADLVLGEQNFHTFCKTGSDANHMYCKVTQSRWIDNDDDMIYSISANRFLRGMVRLIVGMCINVALGKLSIGEVEHSMSNSQRLKLSWSVPAKGLCLTNITYPKESKTV